MIRAEGGLVNPYRSSLLESHIAALSGDPEPRRAHTYRCLTYGRSTWTWWRECSWRAPACQGTAL